MPKINEVPFDQFSRQSQVKLIIDMIREKGKPFKILDVGGYRGRTADFLTNDNITVLDLYDVEEKNYVKGSALDIPFAKDSFDLVVSFDVLEHIPKENRELFLEECSRVAKIGVLIAAPNSTEVNLVAESLLNDQYVELHGHDHEWLSEHIAYEIPDFAEIEQYMNKKWSTLRLPSNDSYIWTSMQEAIFINSRFPMASESLVKLNDFYNKNFPIDGGDSLDTAYRTILVCLADKKIKERISANFIAKTRPIVDSQRIKQMALSFEYVVKLLKKMEEETSNYKVLHQHEKKRAEQLHANGEELWKRINKLEKENLMLKTTNKPSRLRTLKKRILR